MTKLPKAQQRIIDGLRWYEESFIQVAAIDNDQYDYVFAKPLVPLPLSYRGKGKLMDIRGLFQMEPIWNKGQDAIECLIRKKILIPEMSNKEFAVQVALGRQNRRHSS